MKASHLQKILAAAVAVHGDLDVRIPASEYGDKPEDVLGVTKGTDSIVLLSDLVPAPTSVIFT